MYDVDTSKYKVIDGYKPEPDWEARWGDKGYEHHPPFREGELVYRERWTCMPEIYVDTKKKGRRIYWRFRLMVDINYCVMVYHDHLITHGFDYWRNNYKFVRNDYELQGWKYSTDLNRAWQRIYDFKSKIEQPEGHDWAFHVLDLEMPECKCIPKEMREYYNM